MDNINLFNSITTFCVIVATFLTYKNYVLIKTIENENHFFKYKIDNYQPLLIGLYKLMDDYNDLVVEIDLMSDEEKLIEQNELNRKIDIVTDDFRKTIIKYSLFLPETILNELEEFFNGIFDQSEEDAKNFKTEVFLDKCLDRIEKIANLMRKDINLEAINLRLNKRTRK